MPEDIVIRHDFNLDLMSKSELTTTPTFDSSSKQTTKTKKHNNFLESNKPRSHFLGTRKRARKPRGEFKPIRNMTDCTERLQVRGAADQNIWKWCSNVLKINKKSGRREENDNNEGLLIFGYSNFPYPMMCHNNSIAVDPTYNVRVKTEDNVTQSGREEALETASQRYGLWSRDFSSLYPVCKVSSQILTVHKNK